MYILTATQTCRKLCRRHDGVLPFALRFEEADYSLHPCPSRGCLRRGFSLGPGSVSAGTSIGMHKKGQVT